MRSRAKEWDYINVSLLAEHIAKYYKSSGGGHPAASAFSLPNNTTKGLKILERKGKVNPKDCSFSCSSITIMSLIIVLVSIGLFYTYRKI